jgi:hypothetical protein
MCPANTQDENAAYEADPALSTNMGVGIKPHGTSHLADSRGDLHKAAGGAKPFPYPND